MSAAITPYTNAHLIDLLTERVRELEADMEDVRQQMKLVQGELTGVKIDAELFDDED